MEFTLHNLSGDITSRLHRKPPPCIGAGKPMGAGCALSGRNDDRGPDTGSRIAAPGLSRRGREIALWPIFCGGDMFEVRK